MAIDEDRHHGSHGWRAAMDSAIASRPVVDFLKRRFASAIRCGDERTATRLRAELDRLMNGAGRAPAPDPGPELPPAA
jgi:hypothetical protein